MSSPILPTWDLSPIVAGGPGGVEFSTRRQSLIDRAQALASHAATLGPLSERPAEWREVVVSLLSLTLQAHELSSFAHCALAADTRSTPARQAVVGIQELGTVLDGIDVVVAHVLAGAEDKDLDAFLSDPALTDAAPALRHAIEGVRLELDRPLQELLVAVDREALHGWGQLYDLLSGKLSAEVELPGTPLRSYGIAELASVRSDPVRGRREAAHRAGNEAWSRIRDECALTLASITGARQTRYDRAGIDELAPTLHMNRVSRPILEALWAGCDEARPWLLAYMERKATLLGIEQLAWWDRAAPLPAGDEDALTWSHATQLVIESFSSNNPDLGRLAERALADRWVDAEPRTSKQQGAFCAGFSGVRQSRVLLTWSDSLDATLTLAHELGHAYHDSILFEQPYPRQHVTMALAETASTFAEAVVRDAALASATSPLVRRAMLDQQLQAGVSSLMDIPARFAFERGLYPLRRQGGFDPEVLSEHMLTCQREAFGGAFREFDPMFWASKLHFYISSFGFYNWPYTFGYLFSSAVYARAQAEGLAFAPRYAELLRLTGYAPTESIAREILDEDLADPDFWRRATAPLIADAKAFLAETETSCGEG